MILGAATAAEFPTGEGATVNVLVHYDPSKPILLQCDASNYGLGAVLSHIMDDGSECPVVSHPEHSMRLRRTIPS